MLNQFFKLIATFLVFTVIVIPNSLQVVSLVCMVLCFIAAVPTIRVNKQFIHILLFFLLSASTTELYILIGLAHGAPMESVQQNFFIYIVSPLLWIIISLGIVQLVPKLQSGFIIYTFAAIMSVALFFYLYLTFGSESVSFFIAESNVNLNDGYAGATMHVYGSFVFLAGGFFASPMIVANKYLRFLLLTLIVIVVVTSGRSAAILSIPVGFTLGMLLLLRSSDRSGSVGNYNIKGILLIISGVVVFIFVAMVTISVTGIDPNVIFKDFTDKLAAGGGEARTQQAQAILEGVQKSFGLGVGHGIGVTYTRNDNFPWRYELIWLATILRVGVAGAIIYLLPFLIYIFSFFRYWMNRAVSDFDIFLFSGFFCALIASNTNPYIESFNFQWMYIFPVIHFYMSKSLPRYRTVDSV